MLGYQLADHVPGLQQVLKNKKPSVKMAKSTLANKQVHENCFIQIFNSICSSPIQDCLAAGALEGRTAG